MSLKAIKKDELVIRETFDRTFSVSNMDMIEALEVYKNFRENRWDVLKLEDFPNKVSFREPLSDHEDSIRFTTDNKFNVYTTYFKGDIIQNSLVRFSRECLHFFIHVPSGTSIVVEDLKCIRFHKIEDLSYFSKHLRK